LGVVSLKKILAIILCVLIGINVVVAGFLFIDFQMFESPETIVYIDVVEVTSDEILLDARVDINNPNDFQLSISDFEVVSKTIDDVEIGRLFIDGGNIDSRGSKSFSVSDKFRFDGRDFNVLKNRVSARIGVNVFGFIRKTIPFEIIVVTSVDELMKSLDPPVINIIASFDRISDEGLDFSADLSVYNPNTFEFYIEQFNLDVETEKGVNVGELVIYGDVVKPKSNCNFYANGSVLFTALDAETLYFNLSGVAGGRVGGINKSVSFNTGASFEIPEISKFIFLDENVDFMIPVQFKLRLDGIHSTVGFKIYNPSNITLVGRNLLCKIIRLDNDNQTVLGSKEMKACEIQPKNRVCVKTEMIIPYTKYFSVMSGSLLPDWIILRIEGDFSISGTRQAFPISLNAYVDPHLIKSQSNSL